jgi:hypothetical protein
VVCIVAVSYIVDHCCLRSDRRSYLKLYCWPLLFEVGQKELFVLSWLVILLTIVVWGRTEGVICIVVVSYIVDHCCLRSDRRSYLYCCGWLYCWPLLFEVGQKEVICIVVVSYIVDHCCLRSDRRSYLYCFCWLYCWPLLFEVGQKELFVLSWLVILLTIAVWGRTEGVICIVVVSYIVDHCCLRSDRRSYLYCRG